MGNRRCNANRCDGHEQVTQDEVGTVGGYPDIEYWRAANNSSLSDINKIVCKSGGSKAPPCSDNNVYHGKNNPSYENMVVGQSKCSNYRAGKGTDVTCSLEELVTYGPGSALSSLFEQINEELSARQAHSIYTSKSLINTDKLQKGTVAYESEFNAAINTINSYVDAANVSDMSRKDISAKVDKVAQGNNIASSYIDDLVSDFNTNIVKECICYSDCQSYQVCYCYGNCNFY